MEVGGGGGSLGSLVSLRPFGSAHRSKCHMSVSFGVPVLFSDRCWVLDITICLLWPFFHFLMLVPDTRVCALLFSGSWQECLVWPFAFWLLAWGSVPFYFLVPDRRVCSVCAFLFHHSWQEGLCPSFLLLLFPDRSICSVPFYFLFSDRNVFSVPFYFPSGMSLVCPSISHQECL